MIGVFVEEEIRAAGRGRGFVAGEDRRLEGDDDRVAGLRFAHGELRDDVRAEAGVEAEVDDGDAELAADVVAGAHQPARQAHELRLDRRARLRERGAGAVEERDPHRDGPHVEVLLEDHPVGLDDFAEVDHRPALTRGASSRRSRTSGSGS